MTEEEKKEPIRPIIIKPGVDEEGHSVIECVSGNKDDVKDDVELLKTALSNRRGVKIKASEGKTCPLDDKPYDESICKEYDELFEKRKEKKSKT